MALQNYVDYIIAAIILSPAIALILFAILHSPFDFPYFTCSIDVSGKRNPQIENLIDEFLIAGNFAAIESHYNEINRWKEECQRKIEHSVLKSYRSKQYQRCVDDEHAFCFELTRDQTRYQQTYYVKTAYKVTQTVDDFSCDYEYLKSRDDKLKAIGYECTLQKYYSKNQRKLLTKELRETVIARDNYTCQKCGKYMPDGVGLQIDHIIPVSKGGKTVLSNLQVLCSKCNGSKSNKV